MTFFPTKKPGGTIFQRVLGGLDAEETQFSADVGGTIGGVIGALGAGRIAREQMKTQALVSKINAKRAAREARYQLGLTRVANQGDAYSNAVFQAAENARAASEAMANDDLAQRFAQINADAAVPTVLDAGYDFLTGMTGAYARRNARRARREI